MDKRLCSANDPSTSCRPTNWVNFGPLTPEIMRVTNAPGWDCKNWHISPNIPATILDRFSPNFHYLLFALAFWNGMQYHFVNACVNSYTHYNASTSCEKTMKIGPEVFELKWDRKWRLCCDSAEIWRSSFLRHAEITQCRFQQVNRQSFMYIRPM